MPQFIVLLLLVILAYGCDQKKVDKNAEGLKLMELSREWSKSASTDSVDKIMSYWADTAIFFTQGQPVLNGKKEILGMVERSVKTPGFNISWEPVSVTVSESGDMAYMIEKNQVSMRDSLGNSIVKRGTGVTIWKKDADGNWKNVVEIGVENPELKN